MARAPRDYKKEQDSKNAKARSRGFANHAEYRRKMEHGLTAPIKPKLVRSPKTKSAQRKRLESTPSQLVKDFGDNFPHITDEQRAQDWSMLNARANAGKYQPDGPDADALKEWKDKGPNGTVLPRSAADMGITRAAYRTAYLNAFVKGDTRYEAVRRNKHGMSKYQYYWFVTLNQYMEADEYESRYGPAL